MGGCEDISNQSDERPLHQNPGHGLEPIVHIRDVSIRMEPNKVDQTELQAIEVSSPVLKNIGTQDNILSRASCRSKQSVVPDSTGSITSNQCPR